MDASESQFTRTKAADSVGLVASIACAIHCAAMPLVIGYLPMLGLSWLADGMFHQVMAIVCFGLAFAAFVPGWRQHGSTLPLRIGAAGVGMLALAAFGLEGEGCACCALPPEEASPATTCELDDCPHCLAAAEQEAEAAALAASAEPAPLLAGLTPYVTPLGGLLLIAGHVTNHRKMCGCQNECCAGDCGEDAPQTIEL